MSHFIFVFLVMLSVGLFSSSYAAMRDDDWFYQAELEAQKAINQSKDYDFDGMFKFGSDYNKFIIEGETEHSQGKFEDSEVKFLYSRYLNKFWRAHVGGKHTFKPKENFLVLGVEGLMPYYIETSVDALINEDGHLGFELEVGYDLQLTQNIVVELYSQADIYTYSDEASEASSGLSYFKYGTQVRYEFNREFAVYLDYYNSHYFGDAKDYRIEEGVDTSPSVISFGFKLNF